MTKTQLKIFELQKQIKLRHGIARYLLLLRLFGLEIVVVTHRIFSYVFRGKHATFETFAHRNEFGSYTESYSDHEKMHAASWGGVALIVVMTLLYTLGGIFTPGQYGAHAASLTVTDNSDAGDGVCDSSCTLRDAILAANGNAGVDDITFTSGMTIQPATPLPSITEGVTINGDTDSNGTPDVIIDGSVAGAGAGFTIVADGSTLSGLVIQNVTGAGISIQGSANTIAGNYIGTNATATAAAANTGSGVQITDDGVNPSENNVIGGSTAADRNIISGNTGNGVIFSGSLVQTNTVAGNYIGTNLAGTAALANGGAGVRIDTNAHDNMVGGNLSGGTPGSAPGNVLSGNTGAEVLLLGPTNSVSGNIIGLNAAGAATISTSDGVSTSADNSTVGGVSSDYRNIISGNAIGVAVNAGTGVTIQNNYVGTNLAGTSAVANTNRGIRATGGAVSILDNVVSGNTTGVQTYTDATIQGNFIGTNAAGTAAISGSGTGLSIFGGTTTVGGSSASERNIVSGNSVIGVAILTGSPRVTLQGNYVGTDATGASAIANDIGVAMAGGATGNTIGGTVTTSTCAGVCNVISGNTTNDIKIDSASHGNTVSGNYVGINAAGTKPLVWNQLDTKVSILVKDGSYGNQIGGARDENVDELGDGNVISGNQEQSGAALKFSVNAYNGTTGNATIGNLIGTSPSGTYQDIYNNATGASGADGVNDFGNAVGVLCTDSQYCTIGDGTATHKNLVSGNVNGIEVSNSPNSSINFNYVGTNKTGTLPFSSTYYQGQNGLHTGIYFIGGHAETGTVVQKNVISGFYAASPDLSGGLASAHFGIAVAIGLEDFALNGLVDGVTFIQNKIGTDKNGTAVIKNNAGIYCLNAKYITIGSSNISDRNIISGNGEAGVGGPFLSRTSDNGYCANNTIENNYFGTDVNGNTALGNGGAITLLSSATQNDWTGNVVGASTGNAFTITAAGSNALTSNNVGVGADGSTDIGNAGSGIVISSTGASTLQNNTIKNNDVYGISLDTVSSNILSNTISGNTGGGVFIQNSNTESILGNTITSNGEFGIKLSTVSGATIGSSGNANTITGHTLNGIALIESSHHNTVSYNTITSNGDVGTVNGAGVYIDQGFSNTISHNTLNQNVRGIALTSDTSAHTYLNTISDNTINENLSSGILLKDPYTQNNTIATNTLSANHAYGIDNDNTHNAGDSLPTNGDNVIQGNTITLNILSGIRNFGASPKIISNTISQNTVHGIQNIVDYGASTNPDSESDDVLSKPIIGASSTKNTINSNAQFGIYSLDTAPTNKSTLTSDNTFDALNASGRIRQDWYGLVETIGLDGNPEANANVKIYGTGVTDPLIEFTTATNGFGPSASALTDVQTWQVVPETIVSPSGTIQNFAPHTIVGTGSTGTSIFSFNGTPLGSSTAFGNINGRYQVATVNLRPYPNTVSGTIYNDANKNGTNDSENGLTSVAVRLYKDDGDGVYDSGDLLIETATSDSIGGYTIENIDNGDYFVVATAPSGYEKTTTNPSNKISFNVLEGGQSATQDFGFGPIPPTLAGTISGTVFSDANKNTTKDSGEVGVKDVTIHLFKDVNENGIFDTGTDTEVTTSTSSTTGAYSFNNLALSTYFLSFSVPTDYTLTTENNPTTKQELTTDGQTITVNFGLYKAATPTPTPTPAPTPTPEPTPVPIITKIISGGTIKPIGGILAPRTGANSLNTSVATAAAVVGIVNILVAVPGAAWPAFLRLMADLFTEPLLALFGSRKLPWGRLFNSLTNRPIDLGLVRLYDARTRTLIGTAVTDATGRFKFFPRAGVYVAKAAKEEYVFPSTVLAAAPSYEKKNLYFGDQIRIDDQNQTFTKDIPLDPVLVTDSFKQKLKLQAKEASHTIVAFLGIAVSIVNVILITTPFTIGLVVLHLILLAIFWRLALPKKPKAWGRVYDNATNKPIRNAVVRIYDKRFGRLLDTAVSDRNGRYGFLVGPAEYFMTAQAAGYEFPGEKKHANDYTGHPIHIESTSAAVSADIPLKPARKK